VSIFKSLKITRRSAICQIKECTQISKYFTGNNSYNILTIHIRITSLIGREATASARPPLKVAITTNHSKITTYKLSMASVLQISSSSTRLTTDSWATFAFLLKRSMTECRRNQLVSEVPNSRTLTSKRWQALPILRCLTTCSRVQIQDPGPP
jgi:hypothetical protein